MGCVVNGPGEAREADLGIAAGRHRGHLFVKGKVVKVVPEDAMVEALVEWAAIIDEGGVEEALARADTGAAAEAEADRAALLDEKGDDANDVGTRVDLIHKREARHLRRRLTDRRDRLRPIARCFPDGTRGTYASS